MTNNEKIKLFKKLAKAKRPLIHIARQLGMSYQKALLIWADKHGLDYWQISGKKRRVSYTKDSPIVKQFIQMAKAKQPLDHIAETLGLPRQGIIDWGRHKGADYWELSGLTPTNRGQLKPDDTTKRKCLKCQKDFDSWGVGNRICGSCRNVNSVKHDHLEAKLIPY